MTIEEAMANAQKYAQDLEYATQQIPILERQYGRGSRQWKMCFKRISDAKVMLEWYNGYAIRDKEGKVKESNKGLIGKLAGQAEKLKDASNLGERFKGRIFGNFERSRDSRAFDQCRTYTEWDLFNIERNNLLILGEVGSGKTHLAGAISNVLIDKGVPVLFGTFSEHLEHIRQEFNSAERKYLAQMKTVPVLVLDDVAREKQSDWTRQILFDVINYRYEHMIPTIITANLNLDALGNYLGRDIFSRLYETSIAVTTRGENYRER